MLDKLPGRGKMNERGRVAPVVRPTENQEKARPPVLGLPRGQDRSREIEVGQGLPVVGGQYFLRSAKRGSDTNPESSQRNRQETMSREREEKTIRAMIAIYCEDHHRSRGVLCDECQGLYEYAQARLGKCPWGEDKPVCANCSIHCYKPSMRDQVREVMRYAGPKMLLRHPVLAVGHLFDKHKPAPPATRPTHDPAPATDAGPECCRAEDESQPPNS